MKKFIAIISTICIIFSLCSCEKEKTIVYEGENSNWAVATQSLTFPYDKNESSQNFKVYYKCLVEQLPYDKNGNISFSIGTSNATCIYTYNKEKGFITPYNLPPSLNNLVTKTSDTEFTVLFPKSILNQNGDTTKITTGVTVFDENNTQFDLLSHSVK